jgi:hypothetical protein
LGLVVEGLVGFEAANGGLLGKGGAGGEGAVFLENGLDAGLGLRHDWPAALKGVAKELPSKTLYQNHTGSGGA